MGISPFFIKSEYGVGQYVNKIGKSEKGVQMASVVKLLLQAPMTLEVGEPPIRSSKLLVANPISPSNFSGHSTHHTVGNSSSFTFLFLYPLDKLLLTLLR